MACPSRTHSAVPREVSIVSVIDAFPSISLSTFIFLERAMATVLITGANKGIGLDLTKRYAARGDTVLAFCRNPEAAVELIAIGDHVEVFGVQISHGASVAALAETIGERPIDTLINNAGTAGPPESPRVPLPPAEFPPGNPSFWGPTWGPIGPFSLLGH